MNTQLLLPAGRALGLALLLHLPLTVHAGQCTVTRLAELPVTMKGMRPTITAQINGKDALFTLDSGAFWSSLTPAAAQQYQLRVDGDRLPLGFQSLYCRRVARVRAGRKQAGEADMSAAMAVNPKIAEQAKRYDIAPAQ